MEQQSKQTTSTDNGLMIVEIPRIAEHEGYDGNIVTVEISNRCPICGGKRGEPHKSFSYDGSRRLLVDVWENPCGHIDKYSAVREEYLNKKTEIELQEKLTKEILQEKWEIWDQELYYIRKENSKEIIADLPHDKSGKASAELIVAAVNNSHQCLLDENKKLKDSNLELLDKLKLATNKIRHSWRWNETDVALFTEAADIVINNAQELNK